jgi:3'(2'), 5'-bisphosphate nucleotidase
VSNDDTVRVAAARAYLESLLSHDVGEVRLTPDAVRFENGEPCGSSGAEILHQLATGAQYRPLREIRELEFREWDTNVVARYLLDLDTAEATTATVLITEHFVVPTNEISAITAIFEPGDGVR